MQPSSKPARNVYPQQSSGPVSANALKLLSPWMLLVLGLAAVFLIFAIYSRSLDFQFILDDHRFTSDPRIQESGHIWDYFANYVWAQFVGGPPSFYRPIFILWLRISFVLAALSPWGWHFLSIAKHLVMAILLGFLVWKLLRDWGAAFIAAMLFGLHPAQTESVSWVTVPDPLMGAAVLAAILLYLRYADFISVPPELPKGKRQKKLVAHSLEPSPLWLMASACTYFTALLAKETAVIFPAIIFGISIGLYSAEAGKKQLKASTSDWRLRLRTAALHTLPFICVTVLYLLLRLNALSGKLDVPTQHLSWRTLLLSSPATLWFYVKAMLWPVKSYSFADPNIVEHFSLRGVLWPVLNLTLCALIIAAACICIWRKARLEYGGRQAASTRSALIMGILLLILPLLLTLNLNALNPGDFLHGRYTYLPLAGLMILVAAGWSSIKKFKTALICVAGLVTIAFATLTFSQEAQWKDDATVFETAHKLAPHNSPVARGLADTSVQAALQLQDEGRCEEAVPIFERVIQDYPDDWFAWAGRGVCYVQMNDLPKAEQSLHRAADISHNAQVVEQWQEVRTRMGLSNSPPSGDRQ